MRGTWARWLLASVLLVGLVPGTASTQDCDVRGTVESPPENANVTGNLVIVTGWAADLSAPQGTGVSAVRIALGADPDLGGTPLPALYGWERPDIATLLGGPRYLPTGFAMAWDTTGITGQHTLYIQVRNSCGWTGTTRTVNLLGGGPAPQPASGAAGPAPAPATAPGPAPAPAAPPATAPAPAAAPTAPAPAPASPPSAPAAPGQFVLPPSVPVSATSVPTPEPGP